MPMNSRMGDRSRPPMGGITPRRGAITGSVSWFNRSIAGWLPPGAAQLRMILASKRSAEEGRKVMVDSVTTNPDTDD